MEKIVPQPQKLEFLEGEYTFSDGYSFEEKDFPYAAEYLYSFLKPNGGEAIKVALDENFGEEQYILKIDKEISITASGEKGIFRAFSTLKQLVGEGTIPKLRIEDAPDIKNRGIMVDISRGKIPKMEMIFEIIDFMADIKYNQLQLYMDGFVFEYKHFADYCKDTMPITLAEMRAIKDRCRKKFIELVPNQNGFGHMEKWLTKPELKELGITREDGGTMDTLNPFDKRSLELVDTIYSDILPEFESKLANIGMDEPTALGMGQTKEECEKRGKNVVYVEYLNKIIRMVNDKYNKMPMFWDDIIFESPELLSSLDKDCIVMDWGYETEMPFMKRCRKLKELGLRFYVCPGTSTWGSFTGRFTNMIYNIEASVSACRDNDGEGFLLTDWGDGGNPQFFAMSVLPYLFGACCSWNYNSQFDNVTYDKQVRIVKACERYADKVIFKADGLGRIAHKMANYYTLENQEKMNGTRLWMESAMYCKDIDYSNEYNTPYLEESDTEEIIAYMSRLKKQLEKYDDSEKYVKEMLCGCDMVILFAEFVKKSIGRNGAKIADNTLKNELISFKETFKQVWNISARASGTEIFLARIDEMLAKFE